MPTLRCWDRQESSGSKWVSFSRLWSPRLSTCLHIHVHIYIYAYTYISIYIYTCIHIYIDINISISYIYMYICMYTCTFSFGVNIVTLEPWISRLRKQAPLDGNAVHRSEPKFGATLKSNHKPFIRGYKGRVSLLKGYMCMHICIYIYIIRIYVYIYMSISIYGLRNLSWGPTFGSREKS